jgi:hypothetical protein
MLDLFSDSWMQFVSILRRIPRRCNRLFPLPLLVLRILRTTTTDIGSAIFSHHCDLQSLFLPHSCPAGLLIPVANQMSIESTYQMMYTRFFLRTGLHASQSRLTDERVFIPRVCEDVRRESGEREMREVASVEDGEEKRKRTAARNMIVIGRERREGRERCSWPEWKRLVSVSCFVGDRRVACRWSGLTFFGLQRAKLLGRTRACLGSEDHCDKDLRA